MYFANGNYFNVSRSLPLVCGHCWYDFGPPDYFAPTQFLEIARARELAKPNWFLPTWFTFASPTRVEHYLAFMTNIQGMMTPPDATVQRPSSPNPGSTDQTSAIVETNKTMLRLGTIFNTMPVTRPPVAMLYSLSQNIHRQVLDPKFNGNGDAQYYAMIWLYVAGKMIQNPFFTVLDEDVIDGTLAAHHKAVVLGGIDYLDPEVVAGLEAFIANGGLVLTSADCSVKIKGATALKATALHPDQAKIYELLAERKYGDITNMMKICDLFKMAEPLAAEIAAKLDEAGIAPVVQCDSRGIAAYRQAEGDIEYLFTANATPDLELEARNALRAAAVTIGVPNDGRPVYDAVLGREMTEFKKDGKTLKAGLRYGPGQMRALVRTARPIGGVQALTPAVIADYTVATPIRVQVGATLLDKQGGVLSGSAPLEIKVVDPLGAVRYDIFRATKLGTFRDELPLAANDPAGEWKVTVSELLSGTSGTASFTFKPAPQCGAIAGVQQRAVSFGLDREHIYRFFRTHRNVTIVKGTADFHAAAAERITQMLEPWDVKCDTVDAAQVNKSRELTEEQVKTWVGLDYAPSNSFKPGAENPPQVGGFVISAPVIILGTPDDNPLTNFLARYGFLPYNPVRDVMPGRGRGMIAWQRDGIYREQESITLVAYDAAGMAEAVGSLYEAMQGMDPLTPWKQPAANSVTAASKAVKQPQAAVKWQVDLPDRTLAIKPVPGGRAIVLSFDGTLASINKKGKVLWQIGLDTGHAWRSRMDVSADGNLIVVAARRGLIAIDGKGRKLFDVPRPAPEKTGVGHAVPVITFVAVSPDGSRIADGYFDGTITVRNAKGEVLWTNPGWKVDNHFFFQTAVFSADSTTLVALSDWQATVLNAADGKEIAKADGPDCRFEPIRMGANLLVSNAKEPAPKQVGQRETSVSVLSATDGKITGRLQLPGIVAGAALTPEGCVIGSEKDGTIRLLKAFDGKVEDQAAWSYSAPRKITKRIAAGPYTAVVYWGGSVHMVDSTGVLKAACMLPHDVADAAWVGDVLVVGLADGRVIGLTP